MGFRKRRRPTPEFGIPPPFSPITGEHADLRYTGKPPYCAMVQIAAADDQADYVVCRGFDPRTGKFVEYEDDGGDPPVPLPGKPGFPVGKPYSRRTAGVYVVGQVFAAMIPVTRIGETPGTAETTQGHPVDLDETINILYDAGGNPIAWILIDDSPTLRRVELSATYVPGNASVAGFLVDDPEETAITLFIPAETGATEYTHRFGIGRAGNDVDVGGTLGYAQQSSIRQRWELVTLQAALTWGGVTSEIIEEGAKGDVDVYWVDYDAVGPPYLVDSGINIEAVNWTGPDLDSGDNVVVTYSPHTDSWIITDKKPRIMVEKDDDEKGLADTLDFHDTGMVTITIPKPLTASEAEITIDGA